MGRIQVDYAMTDWLLGLWLIVAARLLDSTHNW